MSPLEALRIDNALSRRDETIKYYVRRYWHGIAMTNDSSSHCFHDGNAALCYYYAGLGLAQI